MKRVHCNWTQGEKEIDLEDEESESQNWTSKVSDSQRQLLRTRYKLHVMDIPAISEALCAAVTEVLSV